MMKLTDEPSAGLDVSAAADPGTVRQPVGPLTPVRADLRAADATAQDQSARGLIQKSPEAAPKVKNGIQVMPKAGERFHEFVLEEEIGRGALGRVYLARQGDSAGRRVTSR